MLAEVSWIIAVPASVFGSICLAVSFVLCVCGCKTKEPKDDLIGVEGRVKLTNPEDFFPEVNANNISADLIDKTQNSAKRSLPDLPVDTNVKGRSNVNWEPNGDATSELYATVTLQDEKNKNHNRQKSESDSLSPSLTYSKVNKDHPYDKLKKVEHPYAQVKEQENKLSINVTHQSGNEIEDRSEAEEEEDETTGLSANRPGNESTGNIAAATAIAGHVTASEDLPYMTPPTHFSGDSQDSGKGYTSISVREPLSAIRGEIKTTAATNKRTDPHYATVSDDSDDMYAAIDDPSQIYTSESETYAQIHPGSNRPKSAPQPPSVDSLKQMTFSSQSHSRQASSSSLASSSAVSSPKPEKRPANSPLPPTPTRSPDSVEDLYTGVDKNVRSQNSPRNLEDMYAKVNKKGRRDVDLFERGGSIESGVSESSDSMSYKLQTSTATETSRSCHSYLSKSTLTDSPSSSSNRRDATESSFSSESDPQSGYEKLGGSTFDLDGKSDPGYETLNKGPLSELDPKYENIKLQKVHYGIAERTENQIDGYGVADQMESDASDGYARVKVDSRDNEIYSKIDASESDGYARVEPQEAPNNDDGYAKVMKQNNNLQKQEPGYERVSFSKSGDAKQSEPICEPTYESLGTEFEADEPNDPNYESVRFMKTSVQVEPPYQLLRECESGAAAEN